MIIDRVVLNLCNSSFNPTRSSRVVHGLLARVDLADAAACDDRQTGLQLFVARVNRQAALCRRGQGHGSFN